LFSRVTLSFCWRPFLDFCQKQNASDCDVVSLWTELQE
jgi:hypothetical protein